MFLLATIGEDQPRPARVAIHSMFDVFDHLSGKLELSAEGLEEGPRKPGHSGSPATAQGTRRSVATTLFMIPIGLQILSKRHDMAPPKGPDAGAPEVRKGKRGAAGKCRQANAGCAPISSNTP